MKRLISFALFGTKPLYLQGALRNVALIPEIYPGWTPRIYASQEIPEELLKQLHDGGAEVVRKHRTGEIDGMFWRFLPAGESGIDAMVVRDVDSRPTPREYAAVEEWLASGKSLHIMRDHPHHKVVILGGMWGCRGNAVPDMETMVDSWKLWAKKGQDQDFLRDVIYPRFKDDLMVHSDLYQYRGELRKPFPNTRHRGEFVGAVIDPDRDSFTDAQAIASEALFAGCSFQQLNRAKRRMKFSLVAEQWLRNLRELLGRKSK